MKERPILFSSPMVRAILEGRKTQTRRIVNLQPDYFVRSAGRVGIPYKPTNKKPSASGEVWQEDNGDCFTPIKCPFGGPGDRLWVRETWAQVCYAEDGQCYGNECLECVFEYRADKPNAKWPGDWPNDFSGEEVPDGCKWRPSIFMPRAASRITLEITDIRVERLNDISEWDAIEEGLEMVPGPHGINYYGNYGNEDIGTYLSPIDSFKTLWESINGAGSWLENPYVWVITFSPAPAEGA